ncbi:MAG: helix-turn-helix transcriptional regulator [Eggerthellaceae bacterium]|nr:helix-turn-helix transcriptional regulator [Eggerthellaceae bacterium]
MASTGQYEFFGHASRGAEIQDESSLLARQAMSLIESNLCNPPTLQALADVLYVSRTRLCVTFKREVGCSVGEYLHAARLKRAKALLEETNDAISEIAASVGYTRQSSFAERFKEDTGVTPTEWRRGVRAR